MHEVAPKAFLIAQTTVNHQAIDDALHLLGVDNWETDAQTDADKLIEFSGKSCYMSFDKSLNNNLTKVGGRSNHDYIQQGIIGNGHGSVLEHATATFFLTNVSRVVTHELVRHRVGTAFSQTSGRYVRNNDVAMYIPTDIAKYPDAVEVFQIAAFQMEENLHRLEKITGIDALPFEEKKRLTSAFRRIAGNGLANHIVVTANHRTWRHIIELRTSRHAEEEIRLVVGDIALTLAKQFPTIYADMSSEIVNGLPEFTFEHSGV